MKRIVCIAALCLFAVNFGGLAQQAAAEREITIKVVDRKGKPVPNIAVQASTVESGGATDKDGIYRIPGLQTGDSITMVFPRIGQVFVPVQDGVDVILMTLKSTRELAAVNDDTNQIVDLGYGGVTKNRNTGSSVVIDVPTLLKETAANDLVGLLEGQVPGMMITGSLGDYRISLRGRSASPLLVVDGVEFDTILAPNANAFQTLIDRYPVQMIQTITIDQIGAAYGTRGANGVILVNTKR